MGDYRYWVHGSDVNVRFPDNIERIQRGAAGTFVSQDPETINRFFFAIPTPTEISDDRSIEVEEVYLHARLSGAELDSVSVHDGATQIFSQFLDETDTQGEDMIKTFDLNDRVVQSAINFGVEIEFVEPPDPIEGGDPSVTFIAAGAQFDTLTPFIPPFVDEADEQVLEQTFSFRPRRTD